MKSLLSSLLVLLLAGFVGSAFAQSEVVTHTEGWTTVPITVDTTANTYTISNNGSVPTGNFYYSYSGYRCFNDKQTFVNVNPVMFNATATNGPAIYCYPE